ncbi:MAG: UDP-N-acetylmuramoyl-L-alanine--D-glutamate ligase [Acidimicrobiia bacterium]|nr:UDP-N-acetylmuramoyl-L-alanine--D-glutamate ligase [Acidimicrobiia bacterium]
MDSGRFGNSSRFGAVLRRFCVGGRGRMSLQSVLLAGYAVTNQAVAEQLVQRGHQVVAADDLADQAVGERAQSHAASLRLELRQRPSEAEWANLVRNVDVVVPTPGLTESHPVFAEAAAAEVPIISEFDLAQRWDSRSNLAVTGTNGKTTVTVMAAAMLEAAGIATSIAGNTDTPLVEAIRDPQPQVFVVEASSFRLGHSSAYRPEVAAWLNFSADHLDVHASLDSYRDAKAAIWRCADSATTAIVNLNDPVVVAHAPSFHAEKSCKVVTFGLGQGDFRLAQGALWAHHHKLVDISELQRRLPHELSNLLAAAAVATAGGATSDALRQAMLEWQGLAHRVWLVGQYDGVSYYDDSKATSPHAVCAAVRSLVQGSHYEPHHKVALIAGGRNKGLDLSPMAALAEVLRVVVVIGEAASDLEQVFVGSCPTMSASSMSQAVKLATDRAQPGEAVILSPGCSSLDWYGSYVERGEHFCEAVRALIGGSP